MTILATAPDGLGGSWRVQEARIPWLLAPWPVYGLALWLACLRPRSSAPSPSTGRGSWVADVVLLPLLAASPAILVKEAFAAPGRWLILDCVVAIGLAVVAARAIARPRMVAFLGLLGLVAVSWNVRAELLRREQPVADGQVELLLRQLAETIGTETAEHGPPPADGTRWLRERLPAQGWYLADNGDWYWAPAAGLAAGPIRLKYTPPQESDAAWAVVLWSVPQPLRGAASRPFSAEITVDGGLNWAWPDGPPDAVAARRATVGG